MKRFVAIFMFGSVMQGGSLVADSQAMQVPGAQATLKSDTLPAALTDLPPLPRGKSTIFGGQILDIDPVRDQFQLKVFGERPMKILFDERTQVYVDGKKIPLLRLDPQEHASVETTLDGTRVFALSIHILSQAPEGDYQGRVLSYNAGTGELVLNAASREPFKLFVNGDTPFTREGEAGFTATQSGPPDLQPGTLISAKFHSDKQGRGVASQISVLAVPGSEFVFTGNLLSLDMHSGLMVLVDPRDQKSYQIFFNSTREPGNQSLHPGTHVKVTAGYDGTHYVAREIAVI